MIVAVKTDLKCASAFPQYCYLLSFRAISLRSTRLLISGAFQTLKCINFSFLAPPCDKSVMTKHHQFTINTWNLTSSCFLIRLNVQIKNISIPPMISFADILPVCNSSYFMVGTSSYHMTVTRHDFSRTLPSQQWILFMFISLTNSHCCLNQSAKEYTRDLQACFFYIILCK